jgi:peptidoglycan/xylan/chitin deacetylase (PgdA/CDA1 family)/LysM repeat protein
MLSSTPRNTSILLIIVTFAAGIALGWLLRDLRAQGEVATAPTAIPPTIAPTSVPPTAVAPTIAPTVISPTIPPTDIPPTSTPTSVPPTTLPSTITPTIPPVAAAYAGYRVRAGDTLESIAARSGSLPELIRDYNLLAGEPAPGAALIIPLLEANSSFDNEPLLVKRGPTDRPWVAFTLDAGAGAEPVADMLATLRERGVTITFFLTGRWIRENPDLARRIVADGHEIANHTVTHADLRTLDDDAIRAEILETDSIMREVAGVGTRPFFRPPYGAYDERVLRVVQREGFLPVYWTLDSLDSVGEPKTPEFLIERVTAHLTPERLRGAIILAHCGNPATAEALPAILDRFSAMGLEVRKLSEVLGGED